MTAELVGKGGRVKGQHAPDAQGLVLKVRISGNGSRRADAVQRCTSCALSADTLSLVTDLGAVYIVHLKQQRYRCLDTLDVTGTATAFMTRTSRRLFVGCSDGNIYCYDHCSNARLAKLPGHRAAIASLSTRSDTEQLLSASKDAVMLWDMQTYRQKRMLGDLPYGSSQAAFSPAGNVLAVAAKEIIVWHAKSLHEVCRLSIPTDQQQQHFTVSSLSISLDERWLVVGCTSPALLLVYDVQQQCLAHAVLLPEGCYGIKQLQLLPDGASAAVLTSGGCIYFLDTQTCSLLGQLQIASPGCRAVSFSLEPRANSMAVVCSDGGVQLYDLAAWRAKQQTKTSQQSVLQLHCLSKDQLQLLTGCQESSRVAAGDVKLQQRQQPAPPIQVLSEVSNVPARQQTTSVAKKGDRGDRFRVQQTSAAAAALNRQKLQELLAVYGEYPAKYRRMIWEHLLQLPHNSASFSLLQDMGLHPAYKDLAQQMPGGARSTLAVRLQACLSQLAHWCPLFGEAGFLPHFALPFVQLCGAKSESAFEMVATLLLNWCKGWLELFPNPPLPLLRRLLLLVSQHDLELGSHLQQLGIPFLQQLWHHMSRAMSDLLPCQSSWVIFWDHCLTAAAGPGFFYHLICSYLLAQRQLLLGVDDGAQLTRLLASRPPVNIQQVVKQAYKLHESTPGYAQLGLSSFTPLPKAGNEPGLGYPMFTEYPAGPVELQAMERRRIQEAEDALIRRRQVVAELEQRSKQVAFDSAALTAQRQQLAALDAQRRAAMRTIDDSLAAAGARLDDRSKEEKLKQIRLVEDAYQASLSSLRAEWSSELATLKADIEHKRRLAAAALKARQEEEDLKALEFQAQQRLWALQQEELAAAGTSALQDAAAAQAAALTAEQQRKAAEWRAQDEVRTLRQQHENARRTRLAAAAEQEAAKQAAKALLLTQELQAQKELLQVEHQRRLRQLAEDEAELTAKQMELQVDRQAVLAAAGQQAVQQEAQQHKERFTVQQQRRMTAIDEELQALKQRQAELHAAAAELGSAARMAAAEKQLTELEETLATADVVHEAKVQMLLQQLHQDKHAHDHVMDVLDAVKPQHARQQTATVTAALGTSDATRHDATRGNAKLTSMRASTESTTGDMPSWAQTDRPALSDTTGLPHQMGTNAETDPHTSNSADVVEASAEPGAAAAVQQQQGDDTAELMEATLRQLVGMSLQPQQTQASGQEVMPQAAAAPVAVTSGTTSSPATSASSSSGLNISQELDQLLAVTEAEVKREMARTAAAKQQQLALQMAAARIATTARLQPVPEEPVNSGSTARPASAVGRRLPGSITHSASASPATSAASSPTKRQGAGGRPRGGAYVSSAASRHISSSNSPPAVTLALSGLEPLTHYGKAVRGLTDAFKSASQAPGSATSSSNSSTGTAGSSSAEAVQQRVWSRQQSPTTVLHSPETPASDVSLITATSGSTLTGPSGTARAAENRVSETSAARRPIAGLAGDSIGSSVDYQEDPGSTTSLYEPVLLGIAQLPRSANETAFAQGPAGKPLGSLTPSSNSTQDTSSQPSSLSFDAPVNRLPGGHAEQMNRDTPMLTVRHRARTTGHNQDLTVAAEEESLGFTGGSADNSSSSSSGQDPLDGQPLDEIGSVLPGRKPVSRASRMHSSLDESGRVSAELRQSSSATSEELENLLQQLAQYEEHLLVQEPNAGVSDQQAAHEDNSDVGTSMGSVSWSQTLAGLASLLPQKK